MAMCRGRFSADTTALLSDVYENEGMAGSEMITGTYTCIVCGRTGLHAKEYGGEWLPDSHERLPHKLVNRSGKPGYYKQVWR
jgi:hypothetical protein